MSQRIAHLQGLRCLAAGAAVTALSALAWLGVHDPAAAATPSVAAPLAAAVPVGGAGHVPAAGQAAAVAQGRPAALPAHVRAFFDAHCISCHDADTQKGGLNLEAWSADFSHGEPARQWALLYDRVASGEMPPAKRPRPPQAQQQAVLDWASGELRASDRAWQAANGRTAMRRLSRVEYEHTVHDLLGIDIDLKEMLPEDSIANGFDNQDVGLSVSPVLVERYLEAADAALDAALISGPRPATEKRRYSYLDEAGQIGVAYKNKKYIIPLKDAAVFTTENHPPKILNQFRAPTAGRYRFRVSCYTWDNKIQRPLTMLVYAGSQSATGGKTFLSGTFDVPFEPGVVEFEERLEKKDTIRLVVHNLLRQYPKQLEDFKGPGLAVEWVEVEGPLIDQWPPAGQQRLLGGVDLANGGPADAERIIRAFLPRAFRRPVADAEAAPYLALFSAQRTAGATFQLALRSALKAVLCSPEFIYRKELPGTLDSYALASRLSYFLWCSMPDEQLMQSAATGKLSEPGELRRQVERMLADPKSARFTEAFTGQWLGLRNIKATTPDAKLYPEFDDALELAMVAETQGFFDEVLRNNLSLLSFVDSDFAILNERLAKHYDVPGVKGVALRKVPLPKGSVRGGVMTQSAVLKVTANGTNTSPVLRGVWVLDRMLGRPAPPPPKNVPAVEPDIRGATTIRQQLDKHRNVAACASCHERIDPPGYALEGFDVIGGWRENYRILAVSHKDRMRDRDGNSQPYARGPKVEAGDKLPDGRAFSDVTEFKQLLLSDKDGLARALAERLLVYATGHAAEFGDRQTLRSVVQRAAAEQYGFRTLIHEIVQSEAFRQK